MRFLAGSPCGLTNLPRVRLRSRVIARDAANLALRAMAIQRHRVGRIVTRPTLPASSRTSSPQHDPRRNAAVQPPAVTAGVFQARGDRRPGTAAAFAEEQRDGARIDRVVARFPANEQFGPVGRDFRAGDPARRLASGRRRSRCPASRLRRRASAVPAAALHQDPKAIDPFAIDGHRHRASLVGVHGVVTPGAAAVAGAPQFDLTDAGRPTRLNFVFQFEGPAKRPSAVERRPAAARSRAPSPAATCGD